MTLLIIIGIVLFLTGGYLILTALKNWHSDYVPKRFFARAIKESLSPTAYRYFQGIFGSVIIITVLSLAYIEFIKPKISKNKTNIITVKYSDGTGKALSFMGSSDGSSIVTLSTTNEKINRIKHEFELFDSISFKDNYIREFPDFIFEMKNLEVINFTNNDLSDLPVSKIKNLKELRKIILVNNPIDSFRINKIKKELDIEIISSIN